MNCLGYTPKRQRDRVNPSDGLFVRFRTLSREIARDKSRVLIFG